MFGATKTVNHQNLRSCFYAGFERLPHKICCILATRSLADTAHHCHNFCRRHNWLSYLEVQA